MKKARMDCRVNIVCTKALYEALATRAQREGLPLSELLRRLIAAGLKTEGRMTRRGIVA